jgi:NAD(P)-dependent dehydrogenase (short-subunit alcohol dehydrogenase family)
MSNNLNGQVAVVVGAGGGVGLAAAERLSNLGARVVGIVRNDNDLQQKFKQFKNNHLNHQVLLADNTNSEEFAQAVQHITQCDILVNTAGFSKIIPHADIEDLTDDFFDTMLTVNLRSVFSNIKILLPLLKQSPNGLIINISSTAALRSGAGSNLAYAAAKAGLESLTKNLALALAPKVRVVSICPGAMNTGFLNQSDDFYQRVAASTPLGRVATPEDIAEIIDACATQMRFVTGNCFVVDGGRTL